jgi:ATP-dependent Clp protease ATP-binding subunit ClpA
MANLPYTTRTKNVLELSGAAAESLGDPFIGTEHILIGLLDEKKGVAAQFLNHLGVTTDKIREMLLEARAQR